MMFCSCLSISVHLSYGIAIAMQTESNTRPKKVIDWVGSMNFLGARGRPISFDVSFTTLHVLRHTVRFL